MKRRSRRGESETVDEKDSERHTVLATNAIVGAGTRTGVGSSSERQMPNFLAWRSKKVGEPCMKDFCVVDNIPEVKNGRALSGF